MASYNRVVLLGNLTRDIELRHTAQSTPVADVGLAINDKRKNAAGEWVDETTFVEITLWGRTAEVAAQYCSKGSPLFIEGHLRYETWEQDGQKRSKLKVVADRMQLLSSKSDAPRGGEEANRGGFSGSRRVQSTNTINSGEEYYESEAAPHDAAPDIDRAPAGKRDAQPTGKGPGYADEDIPF